MLMSFKKPLECLNYIKNKGWGFESDLTMEDVLLSETKKTWSFIKEVTDNLSPFNALCYRTDCANIKMAIKALILDKQPDGMFLTGGTVSLENILKALKEKEPKFLPLPFQKATFKAFDLFLHTANAHSCDTILDKALLKAMMDIKNTTDLKVIKSYAEFFVASANIKIAIRSQRVDHDFKKIHSSMVSCETLNVETLAKAASLGESSIYEYLNSTRYSKAVPYLKVSLANFEVWCDNQIISMVKGEITNPFSLGPLFAYVLARENEIKLVGIIFSGKSNDLGDTIIKERLRCLYA